MPKTTADSRAEDLELRRTRVFIEKDYVSGAVSTDFPGTYPGVYHSFKLEEFKKNFKTKVHRLTEREMEFDLIGVDASIANSFRRILMAEVPTVAIEHVFVICNTSIVVDEVLSQRIGLIPIKCDPTQFQFRKEDDNPTDLNTVVFNLRVKCTRKPNVPDDETDPDKMYNHHIVTSGDLVWVPQGDQATRFADDPIRPVQDDIVIAKLRPGMEIDLTLHAQKGVGRDHAKFSPVATASYRLLPEIIIKEDIVDELADKFQACFPKGVIDVVRDGKRGRKAVVKNARKDTVSREVLRHPEFEGKVQLTRLRNHFIFSIESTGIIPPQELFIQAVEILIEKCRVAKRALLALA